MSVEKKNMAKKCRAKKSPVACEYQLTIFLPLDFFARSNVTIHRRAIGVQHESNAWMGGPAVPPI
jgi:hypothetical protein